MDLFHRHGRTGGDASGVFRVVRHSESIKIELKGREYDEEMFI
jgi:hypothetical protein